MAGSARYLRLRIRQRRRLAVAALRRRRPYRRASAGRLRAPVLAVQSPRSMRSLPDRRVARGRRPRRIARDSRRGPARRHRADRHAAQSVSARARRTAPSIACGRDRHHADTEHGGTAVFIGHAVRHALLRAVDGAHGLRRAARSGRVSRSRAPPRRRRRSRATLRSGCRACRRACGHASVRVRATRLHGCSTERRARARLARSAPALRILRRRGGIDWRRPRVPGQDREQRQGDRRPGRLHGHHGARSQRDRRADVVRARRVRHLRDPRARRRARSSRFVSDGSGTGGRRPVHAVLLSVANRPAGARSVGGSRGAQRRTPFVT
ncbi:putative Flavodoxin reductases (Ferredoxin-NADPH reductases) family 1 Vanillate O-demethylase oxidoreductase [Burkholderia latens]